MRADASSGTRLLYNLRFRAVLYQVLAVGSIVLLGLYLFSNVSQKLAEQNIATGFGYLGREAGFVISQTLIDYKHNLGFGLERRACDDPRPHHRHCPTFFQSPAGLSCLPLC
jgi:general L-amino acid transport system permease protein